jgi:ABC-type nitrate/sulfonate/bicarbonate transport system substrate-binding protein
VAQQINARRRCRKIGGLSRVLLPAVCLLTAAFAAAGCGSTAKASHAQGPEKPNLVVGTVPTASSAGLYPAQQDGMFKKAACT